MSAPAAASTLEWGDQGIYNLAISLPQAMIILKLGLECH
jgi:hypothetical protein